MSTGKLLMDIVVVFIIFGAIHVLSATFVYAGGMAAMEPFYRMPVPEMSILSMHLAQSIVIAWVFQRVASANIRQALVFGAMMGGMIAATDAVWFLGMNFPKDAMMPMGLTNLVAGIAVGAALYKLKGDGAKTST